MELNTLQGTYWNGLDWEIDFPTGGTSTVEQHIKNKIIHVTQEDRNRWDSGGGTGGTTDYNVLSNKPQINNVTLTGNTELDTLSIQKKLESSVNIKTINGETLLITGSTDPKDIAIKTAHPFLPGFVTGGTFYEFCRSIIALQVPFGMSYLGGVHCATGSSHDKWPTGLNQCECLVEVIENVNHEYELYVECYSANMSPYVWARIYWQGNEGQQGAMEEWLTFDAYNKVTKTSNANKIYGTDNGGDQTTYDISNFQKKLIDSGTSQNIKTVNGNTLLGSGNLNIRTFSDVDKSMDKYKDKNHTVEEYLTEFTNKIHPESGNAYLTSGIGFSNLPKSFHMEYGDAGCEMFIYVPAADYSKTNPNVVYVLEIETTNNFTKLWYGGPGKFMGIYQVENGSVSEHMPWKGIMTCPQSDNVIDGEYKYIPVKDSDGVSKYWLDKIISDESENRISGDTILQEEINTLKSRGHFLSLWDAAIGLPVTQPKTIPYDYNTGDYYIVSNVSSGISGSYKHQLQITGSTKDEKNYNVSFEFTDDVPTQYGAIDTIAHKLFSLGYKDREALVAQGLLESIVISLVSSDGSDEGSLILSDSDAHQIGWANSAINIIDTVTPVNDSGVNYKPDGTQYVGSASTVVEENEININDTYYYDGATWQLQNDTKKSITFVSIVGQPKDNIALKTILETEEMTRANSDAYLQIAIDDKVSKSGDTMSGDLMAPGFYETSDIRKKNIIGELDIDKCYDLIDKCSTILYTLKNDESNKTQIGLVAQEVEGIFPELINMDSEGFKTLDYSRISVIILKVMKEILKELKELKK